ncbi:MAG: tyrosine-type recombinase/integrase [Acidimicrobiales bacterium]
MSQPALRLVAGSRSERRPAGETGWLEWLMAHIDVAWRPGEWDQSLWLFTGDLGTERTAAWPCRTPGCPLATRRYNGRCTACRRARVAAGVSEEQFDRAPRRPPVRPVAPGACAVAGCESEAHSNGLCFRHERAWRRGGGPIDAFVAHARPLQRAEPCLVAGCGRERVYRRGLCWFHDNRLRRHGRPGSLSERDVAAWAAGETPRLGYHQFSLAPLAELVRFELLYALQRRDMTPPPLDPLQTRILVSRLVGASSARHADPEAVCEAGGVHYNSDIRGLFRDLRRYLDRAWVTHAGVDPYAGEVWEVALLDLQANASRRWPATAGVIDFRGIELGWLRQVLQHWARTTRPYLQRLREALMACRVASQALVASGRTDPASLDAGDFTGVVDALSGHRRADGSLYSASHRNLLVFVFCEVIEHGRTSGLMAEIPDPFRPTKRRPRVVADANEDQVGKALPESVIRRLDEHLHLLGADGRAGSMSAADMKAIHQAIYRILRDTGRRPGEVVSLKVGCVEVIDGQHNLIYDNHKAARLRRRLPITAETAGGILAWERRRAGLATPPAARRWLFPSPQRRSHQALGHLTSSAVGRAFRAWARKIPTIDGELLGPDGTPLPFDRSLIVPYALRHSYAQRHADGGVPVDVLKELLDHVAIQTTLGYYSVSLKRKAHAIGTVGSLAVDADGKPAPFTDAVAYERASVSVPFGNCTEPSNVRAGGGHCPIRFQCAGCGFYRPDPSYLPALEEHVASLRADRETARAMRAADYVLANLTAEIDAFGRVAEQMRRRLAQLGPDEQAEVEAAARLLRRARAARRIPVVAAPPGEAG